MIYHLLDPTANLEMTRLHTDVTVTRPSNTLLHPFADHHSPGVHGLAMIPARAGHPPRPSMPSWEVLRPGYNGTPAITGGELSVTKLAGSA